MAFVGGFPRLCALLFEFGQMAKRQTRKQGQAIPKLNAGGQVRHVPGVEVINHCRFALSQLDGVILFKNIALLSVLSTDPGGIKIFSMKS